MATTIGEQVENAHAGQGPVMLDIGGDVGALVVLMPATLLGQEIEIRQSTGQGNERRAQHVAVLARPGASGPVPVAVFPQLRAGVYELYQRPSGPVRLTVTVAGGDVTQAAWPTPS
jgi:hypothetical protein